MKFFQVTAIINAQTRRIETTVKEDNARFTQSILNQNQKNEKTTLSIPENPIDNLNLSSNYIKMNQKNNKNDIKEITTDENFQKLKLLQLAIKDIYGRGINIYIPDINRSEKLSTYTIYGRDEKVNKKIIDKKNTINTKLLSQIFNYNEKTSNIKINDKYVFYIDNESDLGKDIFEIFHDKFILIKFDIADVELFDTNMSIYDGLRIWDASENIEKPKLFAFGVKNYGSIFCDDVLFKMYHSSNRIESGSHDKIHIDIKL